MTEKEVLEIIEQAAKDGRAVLDLSNKGIESLPRQIGRLTEVTELNVNDNQLRSLPAAIGKLVKLTDLCASINGLSSLPSEIGEMKELRQLVLGGNELRSLPLEIGNLKKLTWLNLYDNHLCSLPSEIRNLEEMTVLILGENRLSAIPVEVSALRNLTKLLLGNNRLRIVPGELSQLTNLTTLFLQNNELRSVPAEFGKLTKLTTLYLGGNQLTSVPAEFGELTELEELHLDDNTLRDVSVVVGLRKLKRLDLRRNQISELPRGIVDLGVEIRWEYKEGEDGVFLAGNPLESPPVEVVKRGTEAVRDYFRQLDEAGTDRLYEAKLLIVGEGGAGKTTLAKKIDNPDYKLAEEEESTEGIDVIEWHFEMKGGQDFRVNIWDFGGQEIYHATHQFFLTKRSLYALVADDRKEDTDFNYWLNIVELLTDNSPILIVKNEKQDRHRDINESALRGQFENIKEFLATNLATNRGLEEIKDEIRHQIGKLPHVGSELPRTWVKVREALDEDERSYIGLGEYFAICEKNGFKLDKDRLQLSGYLHDLGVCLHFQGDVLLKETIILKPEWGTDAVYKVLDDKEVIKNGGRFTKADIKRIWSDSRYKGMQAELLQLMINFKLCYEIQGAGEYIAPELLGRNRPEYEWDEGENLIMRYTYEFMPKGIVTQIIVAMHPLIADQELVWREGAVFERDGTRAEIVESYDKREVVIRAAGEQRKELMTIVTYELEKIHDTYRRLKYSRWIPCNCAACKGSQEPHSYKHDILMKFVADRKDIQCQRSYEMVNARELIDGVIARMAVGGEGRRFRVALSFPGERRGFVGEVAGSLVDEFGREDVFYDKNFEAELARPDLDTYLQGIYHDESDLIVVFLCAEYEKKEWCGLEWRAVRDLIKDRKAWEIMFVRFDDAEIPGVYSIDGYVNAEGREPGEIAKLIIERYRKNRGDEKRK